MATPILPAGSEKAGIYATLSSLNTAFSGIVQDLQKLQRTSPFKPKSAKLLSGLAQELQAEINQDFLEDLHQMELDDWNRFGKIRDARDKELRDPDDVFIQAAERKKQLAKQKRKKR
jgi:hypothetical protein